MKIVNSNYSNFKFQSIPKVQDKTSKLAFKGVTGDKAVEIILKNKEKVVEKGAIAALLALVGGLIGLNKEKVADVFETLGNKIKKLSSEKDALEANKNFLQIQLQQMKEDAETAERVTSSIINGKNEIITNKDAEISNLDAEIAKLKKYEAMAKVKSVEELDIVSPEQFVELLKEAREAMPKAKESALSYLFTGQGQEEFLAQIERNNKILKAKIDGITNIPEMNDAYKAANVYIGVDPVYVAQEIIKSALIEDDKGSQINYNVVRNQILKNMNAILEPMKKDGYRYEINNDILAKVSEFREKLNEGEKKLLSEGWVFDEKKTHDKNGRVYYSFKRDDDKFDVYLTDLAYKNFGFARLTKADGEVLSSANETYW